ncbi:hypothetical protein K9M16_05050, partial [Candidatus Babeliales bacterium]|nr:hypothetical protein [Candidatus Babeliales bacterium]
TIGAPVTFSLGKSAVSSCAGNLPLCMGLGLFAISAQQINVAYNQNIAAGHCVDVFDESSGKEARNGCSVVRTIPYEEIDKYCAVIESND